MAAVDGSAELRALAARLKVAGEVGIRREMIRALRKAAAPIVPKMQDSARQSLPKAGGMNEYMAARKPKVSVRTTGKSAGVSIRYKGKGAYSDKSGWRHPVFGRRDRKWATTTWAPAVGWFERGGEAGTPEAKAELDAVLARVALEVNGRGIL